jgi:hypothetical protein
MLEAKEVASYAVGGMSSTTKNSIRKAQVKIRVFGRQEHHAQTCVVDNSMAKQTAPSISSRLQPRVL